MQHAINSNLHRSFAAFLGPDGPNEKFLTKTNDLSNTINDITCGAQMVLFDSFLVSKVLSLIEPPHDGSQVIPPLYCVEQERPRVRAITFGPFRHDRSARC